MSPTRYRLVILPEVVEEIAEAAHWYERQQRGLGSQFMRALRAATAEAGRAPLHYQRLVGEARRALLRRFPYAIFFEVHGPEVVVLACLHTARDPEEWLRRISPS